MATSLGLLLKQLMMMNNDRPVGPPTIRVLLVEDSITDKSIFELALRKPVQRFGQTVHFAVQWADSIEVAESLLGHAPFDVIVSDLCLPESAGVESIERLLQVAPHLPIVVLSGLADEEIALHTVRLGAQDYLVKATYNTPRLVRTIFYAIERKQSEQRLATIARVPLADHPDDGLDTVLQRICELTQQLLPCSGGPASFCGTIRYRNSR